MDMPRDHDVLNVADELLAAGRAEDPFITHASSTFTYGDLRNAVATVTEQLRLRDLEPGSRIGLLSRNSLFWAAGYLAVMRAGHTAVPFPTVLTVDDIVNKARFVDCDTLLLESALRARFGEVTRHMTAVIDDQAALGATAARSGVELAPPAPPAPEAVLLFTSGTTGRPRAVRVTHDNIRANTGSIVDYLGLDRRDRMLVVLPFSYCYGASLLHTHLRVGASLCVCDTLTFPESVVTMMREEGCTGVAGVPSTYQLLLRASSFGSTALPALRLMQQAGGRLPPAEVREVAAAYPDARLYVMYGQTEATSRLSYLPPEEIESRPGSVGRGIPGTTLRVTDEAGQDVPVGVVGEVRARGRNVTAGYWRDPEATAARYAGDELRTGDMARQDEDGYVYIVDRQDDFIKSWGYRVSSQEVEDAILMLPTIVSAGVVGRPDRDAGEAIVAFCTPSPGASVTADDVARHCRATLGRHLVPHEIRFLDELPLNSNGKVVKSALRALAASGEPAQPQPQPQG